MMVPHGGKKLFSRRTDWNLSLNPFAAALAEAKEQGAQVLDLTASNPAQVGLRPDAEAVLRALANPIAMEYDPLPRGLLSARQAVARYYAEQHGISDLDPQHIVLTTSTSEAYSFVMRLLCDPGDEIAVPRPGYPLFEFLADILDLKLVSYPLFYDHGWQLDLYSLEKLITERTRAIVVVHPNNPTGSFVQPGERDDLNALCRQHSMALIADEVFLDYPHDAVARASFVSNPAALTFTLSGLSKISALPQMKLAWVVTSGPPSLVEPALSRLEVIADTYLSMNAPVQLASPAMLQQRTSVQARLMDRVRQNLGELDAQLVAKPAVVRLQVDGGWYAILRVPVLQTDEQLAIQLLRQARVAVHPGHFYGFEDGYLVVSLIVPQQDFRNGVARILRHL